MKTIELIDEEVEALRFLCTDKVDDIKIFTKGRWLANGQKEQLKQQSLLYKRLIRKLK